jgi:hypothetical protein
MLLHALPSHLFLSTVAAVTPPPPACVHFDTPPTPVCGSVITVEVGQPVSFTVQASDQTCLLPIFLDGAADTLGSTFTPPLPTSGNPVSTTYNWVATAAQIGDNNVVFHAVSQCCPADAWCNMTIRVVPKSGGGCTLTYGYWKTHDCNWPSPFTPGTPDATDLNHNGIPDDVEGQCAVSGNNRNSLCPCDGVHTMLVGTNAYTQCQLLCALDLSANGNAVRILTKQLVAAKLNSLNGASTGGTISDPGNPGNPYNGMTIDQLISAGDNAIGARDILTAVEGTQCGGPHGDPEGCPMVQIGALLDRYNNGLGSVPHCN